MNLVAVGGTILPGLVAYGAEEPDTVLRTVDSRVLGKALQRFRGGKRISLPEAGAELPAAAVEHSGPFPRR
jgi:hypothetical protein